MTIYFLADAHLGAKYIADPAAHQSRLIEMLRMMAKDADSIYMLGDIIDFWFEYKSVVPAGFTRLFATLAEIVQSGVKVYWMHGNHDMWTGGYITSETGVTIIPDSFYNINADNCTIVVSHGDTIGRVPASYRILRTLFRSRICRKMLAAIHPRLTMAVGHGWSSHSRKSAGHISIEKSPLIDWMKKYLSNHTAKPPVKYFICGHLHYPLREKIPGTDAELIILGDNYSRFQYAKYDHGIITIEQFASGNNKINNN